MKTSIEKKPNSKVEILIEIPTEDFDRYCQRVILNLGKNAKIKGFREGHVPKEILEKEVDQAEILNQAAQEAIKEKYAQAVKENNLEVIDRPEVEIVKLAPKNPLIFKAKATVLPEIKLPDYKKIASSVRKMESSVNEEDIKKTIEWLQRSRAKTTALNREAQKGDFVNIEYSSPQIEMGQKKQDAFVLEKGHFVPGFEEKITGMKTGEEKEFSLTLPEKHSVKELAGKEITFKVKMNGVFKMELPELNDQFAKTLGNFQDLDSLKKNIKEGIKVEKEREAKERLRGEILEKIINSVVWDIPSVLIESERDRIFNDLKQRLSQNPQASFEDYLKKINKTEEEVKRSLLKSAQGNVKSFLILRGIAKKENIQASDQEIEQEINEVFKKYPDLKAKEKDLDLERIKQYTSERITNEKVLQLLEEFSK